MNNKTYSYKISDNLKDEIYNHYKETFKLKTPPYAVFQSDDGAGTIVTLYESGKIVFQGISADIDYEFWKQRELQENDRDIDADKPENSIFNHTSTIGSDEVGTGDYFGPVVVTASYVPKDKIKDVLKLGVRDSKKINDTMIKRIAPSLINNVVHETYIMTNEEYNNLTNSNLNKIKAVLHNKVLLKLNNDPKNVHSYIVVDQFCERNLYYNYIKDEKDICRKIWFTTKAEDKCLSVAVSSIISRYVFLKEMEKLSEKYGELPMGASDKVDAKGAEIVKKFGFDELKKCAKLNYKNKEKIKKLV